MCPPRPFFALVVVVVAAGNAALAGPADGRGPSRGEGRRGGAGRYVSAQAYHHAMRAELALAAGHPAQAVEELKLARVYDQDSLYLLLRLGGVLLTVGSPDRAERLAGEARRLAPGRPEVLRFEAKVALARGATQVAEATLKRVVDKSPGDVEAVTLYAELLCKSGREAEAIRVLKRAAERAPQAVEPLLALAAIEQGRGAYAAAAMALERAAARDPRRGDVAAALAATYHHLDRDRDAAARLREVIEEAPQDGRALWAAAEAELWIDEDERAARWLARLERQLDPVEWSARAGGLYAKTGRYSQAAPLLAKALAARPGDGELRLRLAEAQRAAGALAEALATLERTPGDDPQRTRARILSVSILLEQQRAERAELALQPILATAPEDAALLATQLAIRQAQGHGPEAIDQLPARAREVPEVQAAVAAILVAAGQAEAAATRLAGTPAPQTALALAELERSRGREDVALELLRKSERRWPQVAAIKAALATILAERSESLGEASRLAAEALALEPDSPTVLLCLGVVAVKRGESEAAGRYWERARRLAPRDPRFMRLGAR